MRKSEMIGLRIPIELLDKVDQLKEIEETDRTTIILNALRYWVKIEGKVTTDNEYLTRLKNLDENNSALLKIAERHDAELAEMRKIIAQQSTTIDTLLEKIPRK